MNFYSDTLFAGNTSIRGYRCGQVLVHDLGYSKFIPMKNKAHAGQALEELFANFGVLSLLHTNGSEEITQGHWKPFLEGYGGIKQTIVEPYSPWQNRAEAEILELKKKTQHLMASLGAHK
jgi:hypothetical protein